jgi:hypothetical protein
LVPINHALLTALSVWRRQILLPPSDMSFPDICAEITQMRKIADLFEAERDRVRRGDPGLWTAKWVSIVTTVISLPGIVSDALIGGIIAVVGFLGMVATEWKASRQAETSEELDLALGVIDDRIEALNEEVLLRFAQRSQP